eukprot:2486984-Amphidinium_carterae.2
MLAPQAGFTECVIPRPGFPVSSGQFDCGRVCVECLPARAPGQRAPDLQCTLGCSPSPCAGILLDTETS